MTTETKCPVCLSIDVDTRCRPITADEFECDVCGCYTADVDLAVLARDGVYDTDHWELSKIQRAVLSHGIRLRTDDQRHRPTQSVELYARDSGWARAENTDRDVVRLSLISTLISYRPRSRPARIRRPQLAVRRVERRC